MKVNGSAYDDPTACAMTRTEMAMAMRSMEECFDTAAAIDPTDGDRDGQQRAVRELGAMKLI